MQPLVEAQRIARIDREAQDLGIPEAVLMENAGRHALRLWLGHALESGSARMQELSPVVAVAGGGNNGGDALVMARVCADLGIPVTALLLRRELKGAAAIQLRILENLGISLRFWDEGGGEEILSRARWIVDGVAGTGVSGALRGEYLEAVEAINRSGAQVVAVDVPSGLTDEFDPSFTVVRADVTVSMGVRKRALYHPGARPLCGRILVGDPGFPSSIMTDIGSSYLAEEEDLNSLLPEHPSGSHKGDRGYLALFGGSEGTSGAALLASTAALAAGCGLLTVYTDPQVRAELASGEAAVMVSSLSERGVEGQPSQELSRFDALVIGPGWGVAPERRALLCELLALGLPTVIDADGLNNLAQLQGAPEARGATVLTPHPGEAGRLLGVETSEILCDPPAAAQRIARRYGAVCLLKGAVTVVADGAGRHWFIEGLNAALATAGSGDVLAGVVGSLLAQGLSAEDAAVAGALLHQAAGRSARQRWGWFAASRLPEEIGLCADRFRLPRSFRPTYTLT